jgi:hypothetical protein
MKLDATEQRAARDIGIPVKTVMNGRLIVGGDGLGRECLYGVMAQNSDRNGTFLLQIDCHSGAVTRFDLPSDMGNGLIVWSAHWRRLFIFASAGMHGIGRLYDFDPATGVTRCHGRVHPTAQCLATSIDEAPDGTLYLGSYDPGCRLIRFRFDTGQFTDLGVVDPDEYYCYVQCGQDGAVACLVKMARPHVVVLDPADGTLRTVGPTADTDTRHGHVELVKGGDGKLYIVSHEGTLRLDGVTGVPVATPPPPAAPPTLADGSTCRFLDGRQDNVWLTRYRMIEIRHPDGRCRVLELDYEADGTPIYILRAGTDGKIYGSSILPLHFFSHDPATGALIHHGACCTPSGEVYSMDCMDGKLYFCSYTHAILSEFDFSKPFNWGGPLPGGKPGEFKQGTGGPNLSYAYGPDDNPKQIGRMDEVSFRPRDMVAGPAGKVWVTSIPDYGMWGGVLSWYDPATGRFGGGHRHIIENCSPIAITHLADRNLLALGFSIYGGSGTTPRAAKAGFALWDPAADRLVWKGDLGLDIVGVMDIEDAGNGLAYAIVHSQPENVLTAELMLLDLPSACIVARMDLTALLGWPLEVSFQKDDRFLYGLTCEGLYGVALGTLDVEVLWQDKQDGPGPMIGAGALRDGVYYFGSGARLRSIRV